MKYDEALALLIWKIIVRESRRFLREYLEKEE
jgi:hypothetical protein